MSFLCSYATTFLEDMSFERRFHNLQVLNCRKSTSQKEKHQKQHIQQVEIFCHFLCSKQKSLYWEKKKQLTRCSHKILLLCLYFVAFSCSFFKDLQLYYTLFWVPVFGCAYQWCRNTAWYNALTLCYFMQLNIFYFWSIFCILKSLFEIYSIL